MASVARPIRSGISGVTVPQAELQAALGAVVPLTRRAPTLPILKTVRWSGDRLVATDRDTTVEVPIDGAPGPAVCLPAAAMADLVQRLPRQPITIEWTEAEAVIQSGKERFRFRGIAADQFPLPREVDGPEIVLHAPRFGASLARVRYAVNTTDQFRAARPSMAGVHIVNRDDQLVVEAIDGARAAQVFLPPISGDAFGVILAPGTVDRIMSLLDGVEGDVAAVLGKTALRIERVGHWTITALLVDQQFPDTRPVIRLDRPDTRLRCDRDEWLGALTRIRAFAPETGRRVVLRCADGTATFWALDSDTGEGTSVANYTADASTARVEIALNADHFRDAIRFIPGVTISVRIASSREMAIIEGDENAVAAVAPLALPD